MAKKLIGTIKCFNVFSDDECPPDKVYVISGDHRKAKKILEIIMKEMG